MTEAVVMADAENATASWHGRLERRGSRCGGHTASIVHQIMRL
jgi:hypothetical protein